MKKIIFCLLSTIVLLALLVGCATTPTPAVTTTPETTPTQETTLTPTTPTVVPTPDNPEIIMASTTSTRDSGLMDVLIPIFQQKTGYKVKPIYVGSGAAMTMGKQGNADVLLVHSPTAELQFVADGYGVNRTLIMHNDFIIVGPPSDPVGINGMTRATDALQKIADAKFNFYSRGDNSGTDVLEKSLWKQIGIIVSATSTTNPNWYIQGGTGAGMLDLLRIASERGGYTITDRATYLANQGILDLKILVQGDPALLNIYHVIIVSPLIFGNVNFAGAKAFCDFMADPETQKIIGTYGVDKYGQPLFFPDAGKADWQVGQ